MKTLLYNWCKNNKLRLFFMIWVFLLSSTFFLISNVVYKKIFVTMGFGIAVLEFPTLLVSKEKHMKSFIIIMISIMLITMYSIVINIVLTEQRIHVSDFPNTLWIIAGIFFCIQTIVYMIVLIEFYKRSFIDSILPAIYLSISSLAIACIITALCIAPMQLNWIWNHLGVCEIITNAFIIIFCFICKISE